MVFRIVKDKFKVWDNNFTDTVMVIACCLHNLRSDHRPWNYPTLKDIPPMLYSSIDIISIVFKMFLILVFIYLHVPKKTILKKVLVYSIKNEGRSQMAEGWLKYYGKKHFETVSAGKEKGKLNIYAQKAMSECVLEINNQKSSLYDEHNNDVFDYVLFFDKQAYDESPDFKGAEKILFDTPNPADYKLKEENEKERLQAYVISCNAIDDNCFIFVQKNFMKE